MNRHQERVLRFEESLYGTLRKFQRGEFKPTGGGVRIGQLSIELSSVLDEIKKSADEIFRRMTP